LTALIDAAEAGAVSAGGELRSWDDHDPLEADAFLIAAPALLFGLPGDLKARLDGWLDLLPQGRLIPRTADKPAGFLCVYEPDDDAIRTSIEMQLRGIFGYLGMVFRGCASGYAPRGSTKPADERLLRVAHNLGAVLATNRGFAGWPSEYVAGVELFNRGEFWEAHEVWEDLWIREETELKLFYQGLIQVAGAFHHFGHTNWGGMKSLLFEGVAKISGYRPFCQGIDVDALLDELSEWQNLAAARTGKAPVVTRVPQSPPRIELKE
jgi:predicted metal-dependent hydrolase